VPERGRVLEIGPGTGQATLPMAQRGYRITAVDLGENLARVARRNLAAFPDVEVQVSEFEDWPLPAEPFDLVMAITSFHWLDHDVALPKIAAALRPGGALAITTGGHVAGSPDDEFFHEAQVCYETRMPGTPPGGMRLTHPSDIPLAAPLSIEANRLFGDPQFRRYHWLRDFTTDTYIDELNTYSSHIALPEEDRAALLACIRSLLDERYKGRITKAYLTDLVVVHRAVAKEL
jgi:SAM-dependent methyltransferase